MIEAIRNSKAHIFPNSISDEIVITGEDYNHLAKSLRLKVGEVISAAKDSKSAIYEIAEINKTEIKAHLIEKFNSESESKVELFVSLFKIDRLETGIAKAIETGASRIVLGNTVRSSVQIKKDKIEKVISRLNQISKSSAMQSRRQYIPEVLYAPDLISQFLISNNKKYMCDPKGENIQVESPCSFLIGPEGGFDESEINLLTKKVTSINLSPYILRADTAMPIAVSKAI